jgi:hypothetical protein
LSTVAAEPGVVSGVGGAVGCTTGGVGAGCADGLAPSTAIAATAPPITITAPPTSSGSFERGLRSGGTCSSGTEMLPVHWVRTRVLRSPVTGAAGTPAGVSFGAGVGVWARRWVVCAGDGTLAARCCVLRSVTIGSPHASRTAFARSSIVW